MSGTPPSDPRDVLRRALVEIRSLKEKLAAAEKKAPSSEPIAVVGIGCRFAGGIDSPAAFWRALMDGHDTVAARPANRWRSTDSQAPINGSFLDDVEGFDARFFGIAPREAAAMDPQHRLLLEVTWEAFEHAAIDPHGLAGSRTGVFVGLATNDYARRVPPESLDRYFGVGSSPAVASGRIAYLLDLRGPCLTLDTACSSSLVAVHYAMRALRDRDCDTAIAGGVSLMLGPELGDSFAESGMLAADGRCKTFDARADGYGRGEGAGMIVMRRLSDAVRAGDRVLAVLRGSAINQDGRSAGLTAPNGPAQTALIKAALESAGLGPDDIDYVEAHGTGTPLGDPIEWHALAAAFAGRTRPLRVGAVKTNLGHTEAASGIAGLIKAVLALGADCIPPNLHFGNRNPAISVAATPIDVPRQPTHGVRLAGVSAFGFSGTNAHVVVEAHASPPPAAARGDVLFLSAHDPAALRALAARYAEAFAAGLDFAAACHTAAVGRARLPWWIAVRSPAELASAEPSNGPPPSLAPTAGARVALPTYPFQRERFPLPGAPAPERVLAPDDPLLADTDGLAHLGVLLSLIDERPDALADITFPAALAVSTPRRLRTVRDGRRIALESRTEAASEWTIHLAATIVDRPPAASPTPSLPSASEDASSLYGRIAAYGFRYGEAAWRLSSIALSGDLVVGTLLPDDIVSPGVVEAMAQLAYALLPKDAPPVMLASLRRLAWHASGTPAQVWLRRTSASADGGLSADLGLSDAGGRVLLQIDGATFAPLPNAARRWSRVVAWREVPAAIASVANPAVWHAPKGPAAALCSALLDHLRTLSGISLRIVTHGAQVTGREAASPDLAQASLWGMAQAIMAERPDLHCRLIDLDPDLPADAQKSALAAELAAEDEPAIALRGGLRLARRIEPPAHVAPRQHVAVLAAPGVLQWQDRPATAPGPGMVRIDIVAAGLTFRDRLLFNGIAPQAAGLGCDCAGLVAAIGPGVTGLAVGDPVIALADSPVADMVTVPAESIAPAPCLDLFDAATMPVPYLTALAGLGGIAAGDCVLVHQAASATGQAALALIRRAGARAIVTASTRRRPWFAGAAVLDSRNPASWAGKLAGVTVAFGAFDDAALAQLAGIRIVNLSKQAAAHFDLDRVPATEKRRLMSLLQDLPPLPRRVVPRDDLGVALSNDGPVAGRTVVQLREPPPARVTPGAAYVVTGAAGALGQLVSAWLMRQGAIVWSVDRKSVDVSAPHVSTVADAGDPAAMSGLLDRIDASGAPLRGVFHCAAIVDDDRLDQQTNQRLSPVLAAKIDGALTLDRLTRERRSRLDHFVLFASIVGVLPSARQSGYAAANAVLDQIAQARRCDGLPGLSLDWGPWAAGIGRAMGVRSADTWAGFGVTPILPALGLRALPSLLAVPEAQRIVVDMVWEREAVPDSAAKAPAPANAEPPSIERLQAILARLLGVRDPETLDPDAPLMSFGLDSLLAVEFARTLSRDYGRPVPPDFAYSHPTLADAVTALSTRRAKTGQPAAISILAPRWTSLVPAPGPQGCWSVAGRSALAEALRDTLTDGADNLVDLSALDGAGRDELFAGFVERLRRRQGRASRIVFVTPANGPLSGAIDGFATGIAAEQPGWHVCTVRLDGHLDASATALAREIASDDGESRVRLGHHGRQGLRLVPATDGAPWRPLADATYLVTGASGGIGQLVATHLATLGARHLALASRRPIRPTLLDQNVETTLHPTDFSQAGDIRRLMADLRANGRRLVGIFHVAGVTSNGSLFDSDWSRLGASFPAKADAAALLDELSRDFNLDEFVLFSSATAWFGLARTSGYAAANGFLEGLIEKRRAEGLPGQSIAWCAWQGVGMAADPLMWQDGRVPSLSPRDALRAFDAVLASREPITAVVEQGWQPGSTSRLLEQPNLALAGE
jgi:3-oxoacyl-(acyl-carrier-protein) synthase/NADPH:quinone reductase-like Zn-dependent oxidoreductase/acyl carrier protein